MAILEKIRNRAGLAVGLVGFALVLFLVSDAIDSKTSIFRGTSNDVGNIGGEPISFKEFERRVQLSETDYMTIRRTTDIDQNTKEMLRENTWNQLVDDLTLGRQYEALGLKVTSKELEDMTIGKNPDPQIVQNFTDPNTGKFDPSRVLSFLKTMDNDQTGETKAQWLTFEKALIEKAVKDKYSALVRNGVYITNLEAKYSYLGKNKSASFKYVSLNYNSVLDSSIKLTDEDLQKYYQKNLYKFKTEATRRIDFVTFDIFPSSEDSNDIKTKVAQYYDGLKNTSEPEAYVNQNSDTPYDTVWHGRGELPKEIEDSMFYGSIGAMMGPYFAEGGFKIAKLIATKEDTLLYMHASHILIKPTGTDTAAAYTKVKELMAQARSGKDFAELASSNSQDPGSAMNGGDLGWFAEGRMVPEFNNACKTGKKGDLIMVKTNFGVHLIKITDNPSRRKVRIAVIEKKMEPSPKTREMIYAQASEFASKVKDIETFNEVVKEKGLNKRTSNEFKASDRYLSGLENPKEIIRWTHEGKKGDVSQVFELENQYVVAVISSVKEKGTAKLEDVKEQVEAGARKMKKAEMFKEKFKQFVDVAKSPDELAMKLGTVAQDVPNQNFENNNLSFAGEEKYFIGVIFGTAPNKTTGIIEGNNGVYYGFVTSFTEPQNMPKDFKEDRLNQMSVMKQRVDQTAGAALKEMADVQDFRYKFF